MSLAVDRFQSFESICCSSIDECFIRVNGCSAKKRVQRRPSVASSLRAHECIVADGEGRLSSREGNELIELCDGRAFLTRQLFSIFSEAEDVFRV